MKIRKRTEVGRWFSVICFSVLFLVSWVRADFPVCLAVGDQKHVGVAKSDTHWLIVWEDERSGPSDVWAQFLDTTGVLVGSDFAICQMPNSQCFPKISWNGSNYLVVWAHDSSGGKFHVHGRLLDSTGDTIAPIVPISEVSNSEHPDLSWGSEYWLVAWSDFRNGTDLDLYGQLVDGSGSLVGPQIPLAQAPEQQIFLSISWDGTYWLAVWEDGRSGNSDIYGQLVDSTGGLVGINFPICEAMDHQRYPEVGWNDTSWMVVWSDYRSGSSYDIYGRVVDSLGNPGMEWCVAGGMDDYYYPQILWKNNKWIIAWSRVQPPSSIVVLYYVISDSPQDAWLCAISPASTYYLTVWQDNRNWHWDIYAELFDPLEIEEKLKVKS